MLLKKHYLLLLALLCSSIIAAAQLTVEVEGGIQKVIPAQDFTKMPHQKLTVTNPHTKNQETYEGVPLRTLLDEVGVASGEKIHGAELRTYILVAAKDNYAVVLALAEIDPSLQKNQIIVADKLDGKLLDEKHGPLQLIVPEDERPARWIRMMTKVTVRRAP